MVNLARGHSSIDDESPVLLDHFLDNAVEGDVDAGVGAALDDVALLADGVRSTNDAFRDEIEALTRDLTVYVSSNDRALLVSRLINRGARRGGAGRLCRLRACPGRAPRELCLWPALWRFGRAGL